MPIWAFLLPGDLPAKARVWSGRLEVLEADRAWMSHSLRGCDNQAGRSSETVMEALRATPDSEDEARVAALQTVRADGLPNIAEAYEAFSSGMYGYTCSLVGRDSAEELVQESFTRLLAAVRGGRAPDDPRAWLYTVCTNLAISRSRRRSIAARWLHLLLPHGDELLDEAAEQTVLRRERSGELHAVMGGLPAEHRAALLLAAEGFSGREIARILRRSEGATRNIVWRARLTVRDRLEAQEAGR
jgi:RNA polymerase sigma-70 factor (ECF subfamily)